MFLDEIGDLSVMSQLKLLRLLQEGEYFPLGSDVAKRTDARMIAATNRELKALGEQGAFRKDLYYRLQTHHGRIPPLRERLDDLPLLVDHFLSTAAESLDKKKPTPPKELLDLLATYHFPGNIRELEAMVFDAVSRHKNRKLSMDVFKRHIRENQESAPVARRDEDGEGTTPFYVSLNALPTIKSSTESLIAEAMRRANGNQSLAAEMLGISAPALSRRLKRGS